MKTAQRTGRPKLPEELRKVRVTVTLSPVALRMIDSARGETSRSSYIESILPHSHDEIRQHIKEQGAVYTPTILAEYVGEKLTQYYVDSLSKKYKRYPQRIISSLRILDPACGHGELLDATWRALWPAIGRAFGAKAKDHPPDPGKILCAIDIDAGAVAEVRDRIKAMGTNIITHNLKCFQTNALFPFEHPTADSGWESVANRCEAHHGFDLIVANPPWGASTDDYRNLLKRGEYTLCKGQYDTADLFLELAIRQLKPDGFMAFILPDSLFQARRSPLRELILRNTRVMYIGRLGEKIFENVNRACVVLICQKGKAHSNHLIDCMHLTPDLRKSIIAGDTTFAQAEQTLSHKVSQARLLTNPGYRFNIDLKNNETKTVEIIRSTSLSFGSFLLSNRGIELSKYGKVCRCPHCKLWMPTPQPPAPKCPHCSSSIELDDVPQESIVTSERQSKSSPLLVGESVSRYHSVADRWVKTDREGINYKDPDVYKGDKIVVRKTGVGISASLDYSGAFTNQVVYILKTNQRTNGSLPLEFFLGILNSRAMYYYLVKSHGETEWRSHPYLTQRQILDLPLPKESRWNHKGTSIVDSITSIVKTHLSKCKPISVKADATLERLAASAFGLTKRDYKWIYNTLSEVQQLVPIRALREVSVDQIFAS